MELPIIRPDDHGDDVRASDPVPIRRAVRAAGQPPGNETAAVVDAREKVFREAIWRGEELRAVVDTVRAEMTALHRELMRAEETIAELTDIGDAAQLAIDRLRCDLTAAEQALLTAAGQRDALAAELFLFANRVEESPSERELIAQRDALAAELFHAAQRTKQEGFRAFWRRIVRRAQASPR